MPLYEFKIFKELKNGDHRYYYNEDGSDDTRPIEFKNIWEAIQYVQRVFITLDYNMNYAKTTIWLRLNNKNMYIGITEVGSQ
jgi:hypothetical protein